MNFINLYIITCFIVMFGAQSLAASKLRLNKKLQKHGVSEHVQFIQSKDNQIKDEGCLLQLTQFVSRVYSDTQRANKSIKDSNAYVKYYGKTAQTFNERIKKE